MHALKLVLMVVLVLAILRLISWIAGWVICRFLGWRRWVVAIAANAFGLAVFAVFLWLNRLPGEWLDTDALVFGVATYATLACLDGNWPPRMWRRCTGQPRSGDDPGAAT